MRRVVLFCIFIIVTSTSYAYGIDKVYLSLLGFKLEDASLLKIREKLGPAEIVKGGDAGDSYAILCYVSPKDQVTVTFESGEMGGDDLLLSFTVKNSVSEPNKCGTLGHKVFGYKYFKVGSLILNKNIRAVIADLPKPQSKTHISAGMRYTYTDKIPFSKKELQEYKEDQDFYGGDTKLKDAYSDLWQEIEVFYENNKVTGYKVSEITSN